MNFYRQIERTARKPHTCEACGTKILHGERYHSCACGDGETIWSFAYHPDCHAVEIELCKLNGEDWMTLRQHFDEGGVGVLDGAPIAVRARFGLPAKPEGKAA